MKILDSPVQTGGGITYLNVITERERYYRRFQRVGREITIKINPPPQEADTVKWMEKWMEKAISTLYRVIIENHQEQEEYIGLTIASKFFKSRSICLSFAPVDELESNNLWELIESVLQSNNDFVIDSTLVITAAFVKVPKGRGRNIKLNHEDVKKIHSTDF